MKKPTICACRRAFTSSALKVALASATGLSASSARADENHGTPVPGAKLSPRSRVLDTGARLLQKKRPVDAMSAFLNGFHFYADDMGRQVEAFHYCTHLTEDFHQCVIYDSDAPDAKLIGIEYIVSERVFRTLPDEERRLWHSHRYEVRSGELLAPGIPEKAEHALMGQLVNTYGKTWHTWQIDRDHALPLGIPQLMMSFTDDGQLDRARVQARDARFGVSTDALRRRRADLAQPQPVVGADAWQDGSTLQLATAEVKVKVPR
ncbi:OBAP family protein (plasmid) [Mycetohabitans endofungorum]|uniref:OBAP family protein n=1 Tax=Mycetohabitans endofungorum TaxID=417203 RepID=UPI0030CBD31D